MKPTRLPAPMMPLLTPHDEYSMAHLIEHYIDYYKEDESGTRRSVALDPVFVRHYMKYRDSRLPVVSAIVTSPLVLPDGTLLATQGLDRQRGIIFRLQPELVAILPAAKDCTSPAVVEAMRFLTDEWLVDVACDYAGKCILIAAALTIIERAILAERPAFFVTAGQRGGGKTTTLQMLLLTATGYRAAAAAWSPSEEERRKCLFSYLSEGVPAVVWDNIPRGSAISCPSIEKSLTAAVYSDRVLGQTGTRTVPSTTVNMFTGNNISPRGDMASRSLQVRLTVDRPDPENRKFEHADPIAWTIDHRGNILYALYTILLGNPRLYATKPRPAETRFKGWWHIVGSAVEYAADEHVRWRKAEIEALENVFPTDRDEQWRQRRADTCPPQEMSFSRQFLDLEKDEEQTSSLATVLAVLRTRWSCGFKAHQVSEYIGQSTTDAIEFKAALEQASGKMIAVITATIVTWRLKAIVDAPVEIDGKLVALRYAPELGHGGSYQVREV
jgi:hypothetical protein